MGNKKINNGSTQSFKMRNLDRFYKIIDKDGVEMPDHYTGRKRTYEEAKKMVDRLNKSGEYAPYTMVVV